MALTPKIKLKTLLSFPATVLDGVGVDVVNQNGAYQFNLDFGDFAPPVAGLSDPAHQNALMWNSATNAYALVPASVLGSAGTVPEAPNDGVQYGRKSLTWTPIVTGGTPSSANPLMDGVAAPGIQTTYSRGDHIHPTDTSKASIVYVDAQDALKAPLASPVFTGDPTAPTPSPGDNDNSIATTAFVMTAVATGGTPSNANPIMDGVAAPGVATAYSRGDHVHPTDTTRQAQDDDLTAVAALSGTGLARRTSSTPTWSVGTAVLNTELAPMTAFTFKGNNTGGSATPTDVDIAGLTAKASPGGGDFLLLSDQAASGSWKKVAIANLPGSSGGIPEAPNDGLQYGRQSLGWTQITGGGGATPSNALPAMDSTASAGTSLLYSRGDHVHPTDTSRQALDAELTAIAGLVSAADRVPYFTGSGTASLGTFTSYGRSLVAAVDAPTARTTLGLTSAATATPAALTQVSDTNVTLTLGGTPATALLQATSVTVGWAGTLSAARGGFGANISASSGVPLFASGVATFTGTTGTGNFARAADPAFTGNPTAPTPTAGDNDTSIATTAFVTTAVATKSAVYVSDTPPAGVPDNSLWFESDTGILYVQYNDGNSVQWVAVTAGGMDAGAVRFDSAQTLTGVQQAQARSNIGVMNTATASAAPTAPAATVSTSGVMMGMGATCKLTPNISGRIEVYFIGAATSSVAGNFSAVQVRWGTGTAPANGVAAAGTAIGQPLAATSVSAGAGVPYNIGGVVTGLTPGTQYWFDIAVATSGASSTAGCGSPSFTAIEF